MSTPGPTGGKENLILKSTNTESIQKKNYVRGGPCYCAKCSHSLK